MLSAAPPGRRAFPDKPRRDFGNGFSQDANEMVDESGMSFAYCDYSETSENRTQSPKRF